MIDVARSAASDRRDLFREASSRRALTFDVIQKDFWVCFVLDRLFSHTKVGQNIFFKGATSLSKCFDLIERFSEDVDLTVTRAALGFDDGDLLSAPSKRQLKKSRKSIREAAFGYTSGSIFPSLHASISAALDEGASWQLRDAGEGVITFGFPADPELTVGSYLRPEVRLEIGGLSDLEPSGTRPVVPYAAEVVPEAFTQAATDVCVVLARRTLCDKLLLLHRLNTSGEDLPAEHSRHFHDVARIANSPVRAELLADPELLWRAIDYEGRTFPRGGIDYGALRPSDLRLSPADSLLPSLQSDYEAMREMFFSDPPGLAEIASALRGMEADLQAVPTRPDG